MQISHMGFAVEWSELQGGKRGKRSQGLVVLQHRFITSGHQTQRPLHYFHYFLTVYVYLDRQKKRKKNSPSCNPTVRT